MRPCLEGVEPPLKRHHVGGYIYLPLNLWFELVFSKQLELEDLVAVQRTCTAFAYFERLAKLIEKQTRVVFGSFNKKLWNHQQTSFPRYTGDFTQDLGIFLNTRNASFLLFYNDNITFSRSGYCYGVYSSKRSLCVAFKQAMQKHIIPVARNQSIAWTCDSLYFGAIFRLVDDAYRWRVWIKGVEESTVANYRGE